jgi:hypothetical protein
MFSSSVWLIFYGDYSGDNYTLDDEFFNLLILAISLLY